MIFNSFENNILNFVLIQNSDFLFINTITLNLKVVFLIYQIFLITFTKTFIYYLHHLVTTVVLLI